jgi:phosphatidylserine/phosphatidylglycerophosphate/cardiolipin synthase-like enzyme
MHSKYVVRDDGPAPGATGTAAVWTGSSNFTDDAWTLQENNIITVASADVAAGYRRDFDELWASGSIKKTGADDAGTTTDTGATVGWDFAPGGGGIDAALAEAVATARNRIVLATMVLTSHAVLSGLVTALGNGVPVSGIYDSGQMGPIEREWAQHASDARVLSDWRTVKKHLVVKKSTPYTRNDPHDFMHNKVPDHRFVQHLGQRKERRKPTTHQRRQTPRQPILQVHSHYRDRVPMSSPNCRIW